MPNTYYPAILHPADADGLFGVTVPGINVGGSGATTLEALADAAAIVQEVIDDLAADRVDIPQPASIDGIDLDGGQLVMLPAVLPGRTVRVNVTLTEDLVRRIDAATTNRSAFLAKWALRGLREEQAARG
ncbi:type II toxin-antitoxin system HicB family antitoxin [Paracoccus sp. (in: a-proteobacteria)]|uniref:type II toxin-antitoxin system HicB family antitoxin n=1 Tax=Paracoccus sp. TaxID=267 RepID=UPI003A84CDF1